METGRAPGLTISRVPNPPQASLDLWVSLDPKTCVYLRGNISFNKSVIEKSAYNVLVN